MTVYEPPSRYEPLTDTDSGSTTFTEPDSNTGKSTAVQDKKNTTSKRRPRQIKPTSGSIDFSWSGTNGGYVTAKLRPIAETTATLQPDVQQSWVAFLTIQCNDIARLMREGIFFSPVYNLLPEKGYVEAETEATRTNLGGRHTRKWFLGENTDGRPALWKAELELTGGTVEIATSVRLEDLSYENVAEMTATNFKGHSIYNYDAAHPGKSYNCRYDDMPMNRFWPWPRDAESDVKPAPPTCDRCTLL